MSKLHPFWWMVAPLAGIQNVSIGWFFRDGEGDLVISIGFQPKVVLFIAYAEGPGNEVWSHGFDDGTSHKAVFKNALIEEPLMTEEASIAVYWDVTTYIKGYISSLSSDGFTITWTKGGDYANAKGIYLAMK